jgi:hypothetical protein
MGMRAARPLNSNAVRKADDDLYSAHEQDDRPNALFDSDGNRLPLGDRDPNQAGLRHKWMQSYADHGGRVDKTSPAPMKPVGKAVAECPAKGHLIVIATDYDDQPIPNAAVNVDGLGVKTTDEKGTADYGEVAPKSYNVTARKDNYRPAPGEPVGPAKASGSVPAGETTTIPLKLTTCITHRLIKPFLIAKAVDPKLIAITTVPLSDKYIRYGGPLVFGEDINHELDETKPLPTGHSVGSTEIELQEKMVASLGIFANQDKDDKAYRLFEEFLNKNSSVKFFEDEALNKAIENHENFIDFADRTLAKPGTAGVDPAKPRIHQALAEAEWDINQVELIGDLGVPAWNKLADKANGLFVMINGEQYVYVIVDAYEYDSCKQQYDVTLIFALYDVFGLDDEDLKRFGVDGTDTKARFSAHFSTIPEEGITAWWQLQHQFDYTPLVTRVVITKKYTGVPTAPLAPVPASAPAPPQPTPTPAP